MWHQEFTKEQEKLILNLNDPETDPDGQVFTVKIEMKKSSTLLELKQKVADLLKLNQNEFVLKRSIMNKELKNMKQNLMELGLTSGCLIKVEKGKPH